MRNVTKKNDKLLYVSAEFTGRISIKLQMDFYMSCGHKQSNDIFLIKFNLIDVVGKFLASWIIILCNEYSEAVV